MAGTQGERRAPAPAGDEDQDEDQQAGGGETCTAQTGETKDGDCESSFLLVSGEKQLQSAEEEKPAHCCLPLVQQLLMLGCSGSVQVTLQPVDTESLSNAFLGRKSSKYFKKKKNIIQERGE